MSWPFPDATFETAHQPGMRPPNEAQQLGHADQWEARRRAAPHTGLSLARSEARSVAGRAQLQGSISAQHSRQQGVSQCAASPSHHSVHLLISLLPPARPRLHAHPSGDRAGNRPGPSPGWSSSPELRLPREPSLGLPISPESRLPSDFLLGLLLAPARGDCASSLLMSAAASNWLNMAASSAGMAGVRAGAHLLKLAGSISLLGSRTAQVQWLPLQQEAARGRLCHLSKGEPLPLKQAG